MVICLKKSNKIGKIDNVGVNNKYRSLLKKDLLKSLLFFSEINLIEIKQKHAKLLLSEKSI